MRDLRHLLAVLLTAVAATLGLAVATAGPAAACSCAVSGLNNQLKWSDAVFTGELVDAAVDRGSPSSYTFAVEQVYVGEVAARAAVASGAECGLSGMEEGRRYLVFADAADERLSAGLCGGTQVAEASYVERLEQRLGAGAPPVAGLADPSGRGGGDADREDSADAGIGPLALVAGVAGLVIVAGLGRVCLIRRGWFAIVDPCRVPPRSVTPIGPGSSR